MGESVKDGEQQHGVGDLSVEPDILIEGQPPEFGTDPSHEGAANGKQD